MPYAIGRLHVKNGLATIRTEKHPHGKTREIVTLPILPPLQASIDAGSIGDLTYICGQNGRPISFGQLVCGSLSQDRHGLRKCGAMPYSKQFCYQRAARSNVRLEARRQRSRARLARDGASKLLWEQDSNIYSRTFNPVRCAEKKMMNSAAWESSGGPGRNPHKRPNPGLRAGGRTHLLPRCGGCSR